MNKIKLLLLILAAMPALAIGQTNKYSAYLFAYFTGNDVSEESLHFAVSLNGYDYYALNGNKPIMPSAAISSTGGIRDPHILRSEDGRTFYMVMTDMTSSKGWESNRAMVLLKSNDLTDWTHAVVNIQHKYPGQKDLKRVWAPQTIYDKKAGKYMIYWSMKHGSGPDIIYYAYANASFTDLEGEPRPLFIPSNKTSCIDGDIVEKDGTYHLFYKTEDAATKGIKEATTTNLTSGQWTEQPDYKQQTRSQVEGSCVFKLIGQDKYILMYDEYMSGRYGFAESTDLNTFTPATRKMTMDFHPRHGTVMPITTDELKRITRRWGMPEALRAQCHNPILPGYHADPEIVYSNKTKKYYIYSTTDGLDGWGGWTYEAFSSDNLIDWHAEGVVLDAKNGQIPWANGNLWAPAIEERKEGDGYAYYLYYSAQPKAGGGKQIGVAKASNPTGPFKDLGHPIVTDSPTGHGQQIDVDVFRDPQSGETYLYWGNAYMAGAKLNKGLDKIDKRTVKVLTPEGGTLQDYAYREGTYVFYRKGTYYFLWSVDDTGSANYHVAYGTSSSPLGPITVAKNPIVLIEKPEVGVYGTGHNSVICRPGTDEWYIVYHRIDKAHLNDRPGTHRQVCIDRLYFNEDGTIRPVVPTP